MAERKLELRTIPRDVIEGSDFVADRFELKGVGGAKFYIIVARNVTGERDIARLKSVFDKKAPDVKMVLLGTPDDVSFEVFEVE